MRMARLLAVVAQMGGDMVQYMEGTKERDTAKTMNVNVGFKPDLFCIQIDGNKVSARSDNIFIAAIVQRRANGRSFLSMLYDDGYVAGSQNGVDSSNYDETTDTVTATVTEGPPYAYTSTMKVVFTENGVNISFSGGTVFDNFDSYYWLAIKF